MLLARQWPVIMSAVQVGQLIENAAQSCGDKIRSLFLVFFQSHAYYSHIFNLAPLFLEMENGCDLCQHR